MKSTLIAGIVMSSVIAMMLIGLWVTTVPPLVRAATGPGQYARGLVGLALPNGDLALVVLPARQAKAGEIALWWAGKDATRVQPLISLGGYQAGK